MIYTLSILALVGLAALGLIYYRHAILLHIPTRLLSIIQRSEDSLRAYVPLSTFENQRDAGLTSVNFDLEGNNINVVGGDSRLGLDERDSEEVRRIMRERRVTFDQARLIRHKERLVANGIDPNTGMPLDSKAVTSL